MFNFSFVADTVVVGFIHKFRSFDGMESANVMDAREIDSMLSNETVIHKQMRSIIRTHVDIF